MNINALEIGYRLDLISRSELLKWSDTNLINDNNLPVFLELSSISINDKDDKILSILDKHKSNFIVKNFNLFHSIILFYLRRVGHDWLDIQKMLIKYFDLLEDILSDSDFGFWTSLKDDIQLKKEGLPSCLNIPRDLKKYFDSHKIKNYQTTYLETILKLLMAPEKEIKE